jgi:hypothetical protein
MDQALLGLHPEKTKIVDATQRGDTVRISLRVFSLSGEKKLHLEPQLPVGATLVRSHHVIKSLELKIDRRKLITEL